MRTKLKGLVLAVGYRVFKILRAPVKWYWKKFNIQTQGVRVMIIHDGSLVLVRHWYNTLWVMPGGGIKKHETPEQAAIREVREELELDIGQLDYKLGAYANTKEGKSDTVHCFVVELSERPVIKKRFNLEVSDIVWSAFGSMPEGTSWATKTRVQEHLSNARSAEIRPW
jgi:8-oxo-dGTP pyrophosphatase MutT (NUDIX family)